MHYYDVQVLADKDNGGVVGVDRISYLYNGTV